MFISPLSFEREEAFIQLGQEDNSTSIYKMGRIRETEKLHVNNESNAYAAVYLRLSGEEITVERQTMGFLEMAG